MKLFISKVLFYAWALTRPKVVRRSCFRLPAFGQYTLVTTCQNAEIRGYSEDGMLTAYCYYDFCPIIGYNVFGISPDDFKRID